MNFPHTFKNKLGILLVNLGTPNSPSVSDVRRYLREFLGDRRVITLPWVARQLILNLFILPLRPFKSAKLYKSIWTDKGSPLQFYMQQLTQKLALDIKNIGNMEVLIDYAMNYANPSIKSVLDKMHQNNVEKLVVIPLFPQYSSATTASVFDNIAKVFRNYNKLPNFRFVNHYHDEKIYISHLAKHIDKSIAKYKNDSNFKLLMSFHSVPQKFLTDGDNYHCQCHKSARLIAQKLDLDKDKWLVSFQSRVGFQKWLSPYTDKTVEKIANDNKDTNLFVVCPGFSIDCLETIEEIDVEAKEIFTNAGGSKYTYIDCLNDKDAHMEIIKKIIFDNTTNWSIDNYQHRQQRYEEILQSGEYN